MKNKRYNMKSKYVVCLTLILVLGLIGSSYAMWSETNFIIGEISTGFLEANTQVELLNNEYIIITEKIILYKEDEDDDCDDDDDDEDDNDDDKQESKIEYSCNYNVIPFTIVNNGTVPLKLEEYGIFLNSTDISHICTFEFDDLVIIDEYNGFVQIDNSKLEELAGHIIGDDNNIIINFYFKQLNVENGGWTQHESVSIKIKKETETINIDKKNNKSDSTDHSDSSDITDNVDRGGSQ